MTTEALEQKEKVDDGRQVEWTRPVRTYRVNVDILEQPDELLLVAEIPGTRSDQVDIQFEDGELTIRGPVAQRQAEGTNYLLHEYGVGDFVRTFRISEQIDATRIAAEYSAGVLTLHLPKVETAKPRKIAVKVG